MQQDNEPLNPGDEAPPDAPGVGEDICRACHGTGKVEGSNAPYAAARGKCCKASAAASASDARTAPVGVTGLQPVCKSVCKFHWRGNAIVQSSGA